MTYLLYKIVEEVFLAAIATVGFSAFTFYGIQFGGSFVIFWLVYWITLCLGIGEQGAS